MRNYCAQALLKTVQNLGLIKDINHRAIKSPVFRVDDMDIFPLGSVKLSYLTPTHHHKLLGALTVLVGGFYTFYTGLIATTTMYLIIDFKKGVLQ